MKAESMKRIEDRLLVAAIFVLLLVSIAGAVLKIDPAWQSPLIVTALLAILRIVTPVDEIAANVKYLRELAGTAVQTYSTVDAYYSDLLHAMSKATASLDLTHIRDQPPSDFIGSHPGEYFKHVRDWVSSTDGRYVRRIIAVRNPKMRAWAEELARQTKDLPYKVRVIDWSVDVPAINMTIVDGRALFLAVTGEVLERTRGLAIEDERVAEAFTEYYNTLWRSAEPLDDYLAR